MPQASPEPESAGSMPTTVLTAPLGAAGSRHCSSHSRLTGPPSGAEGTPYRAYQTRSPEVRRAAVKWSAVKPSAEIIATPG